MDQPLFGEQRKGAQAIQYLFGFLTVAFTLVTLICAAIKGIHDAKKFALALTVLFTLEQEIEK